MELSILAAAREHSGRIGLIAEDVAYTYAELAERAAAIVAWLVAEGVEPGDRVAVVAGHRPETIFLFHALFELGATVVLVHPRLGPDERARIVADAQPVLVIDETFCAPPPAPPRAIASVDDALALAIVYTSGSSGAPKGAVLSRRAFLASARASEQNLRWRPDDRWLLAGPAAHVGGLSVVTRCLVARACVVLPTGAKPSSVPAVCDAIERHRATLVSLPPPLVDMLLRRDPQWDCPPFVRALLVGSMASSPDLLLRARDRRYPVVVTYGMTEACSQVATQKLGTQPDPALGVGQPVPGTEVRLDAGEILVRGPTLLTDYYPPGRHPHPLDAEGWFRTGDLGHLDESGALHIVGRRTDRIVTGGENVDPLEVEHAFEGLPGITGVMVFGVPDDTWGQYVAAAIVGEPLSDEILEAHLARRLADFKRPRLLARVAELPATPGGKPDRRGAASLLAGSLRPLARKPR